MTEIINEEENSNQIPEEIEDIAVVDNGTTYESTESAIIAKEEANKAKLWAQESERQANLASGSADTAAQARDDAVAAKEYAEAAVTDANVVAVGTDLRSTPSNIKTVAGMKSDIDDVVDVKEGVEWIANNKQTVTDVVDNEANINAVAANEANINAVNANKTNIDNVAANETNINAVNANKTNIDINATNINAINTNATNITDIQNASGNAALAKQYAVGLPTEPEEKSAKWWAEHSGLPDQTGQSGKVLMTDGVGTYWGQSAADGDGITINTNNQGKTQAIGVINQNGTTKAIKTWTGTKAQYDAIVTKDANTLYNITDDIPQVEIDLNGKANTDLSNVLANIDYVVESQFPTAENNYTWYRVYKSGWVEQGGYLTAQKVGAGYASTQSLTFPITMQDVNYCVLFGSVSTFAYQSATLTDRTTTGGTAYQGNRAGSGSASIQFTWEVKGMGANQ